MKISPMAAGNPAGSVNLDEGRSAGSDRIARAKALITGEPAPAPEARQSTGDAQVDRIQNRRHIKMRTQRSPDLHRRVEATPPATNPVDATQPVTEETPSPLTESDTSATSEPAQEASEATKPLSPQFAALAKAKRALQLEKAALEAEKKALEQSRGTTPSGYSKDQIKANALSVLREAGVTNEELTEAILRESQDYGPGYSKLETEIRALKEELGNQSKTLTDREAQQEQQVLAQMNRDADLLVAEGDDFEMVREAGYAAKAVDLVHRTYKKTGELMDLAEALALIENELLEDSLKFARLKKVQSKLTPAQASAQQQTAAVQPDRPNTKVMRTLTNRDGSSSISMSKRERAIAAMEGRLK